MLPPWVEPFYDAQFQLLPDDERAEQQAGRLQVLSTLGIAPAPGADTLLEIGPGGGQFAAAAARAGWRVTAVELVASAADATQRRLAPFEHAQVIHGDALTVPLPADFRLVCYWDGFGVGDDHAQRTLLERMATQLAPGADALVEIYTPGYWEAAVGREQVFEGFRRRYGFDATHSRMLDTWWPRDAEGREGEGHTQSLRCYRPDELRTLLRDTGLRLEQLHTTGTPLAESWSYLAHLRRTR
ncbi:MAG: methyltransferase domain-containing protein [Myxococcales bacterium]|nr:methyltransferase domain-containing protein [Myxococcales bacterium]